jgi:hypothetical protein
VIAERKLLEIRLEKLGCLLEEMAGKMNATKDEVSDVDLLAELLVQLLESARDPQEGCRVYQDCNYFENWQLPLPTLSQPSTTG